TTGNRVKTHEILGCDRKNVTLLGFIAPDFGSRQSRFFQVYLLEFEYCTSSCIIDQLRKRIRETACAHVMDSNDGISAALLPAAVDNLLCTPFEFGIPTLYRIKIQLSGIVADAHA